MEGRYNIVINTPGRKERGTAVIIVQGGRISGSASVKGYTTQFKDGRINGDEFEFSGEVKVLLKRIPYIVRGKVQGESLKGVIFSKYGTFDITGYKY